MFSVSLSLCVCRWHFVSLYYSLSLLFLVNLFCRPNVCMILCLLASLSLGLSVSLFLYFSVYLSYALAC